MNNIPSLEDTILQAVDIVTSKKIASAGYDKTIQATIVSCVDATIGKYKVKYQDGFFFAYSANMDTSYSDGSSVFILVPGGDMNRDKTILGTTKKLGINYVTVAEGDQMYTPIGSNVITSSGSWDLCSYKTETKVLYSVNGTNQINIDTSAAEEYLKKSNYIIAGGHVRNNLDVEQQHQGNYGIMFALDFIDNATRQQVTRYYTVDVDKMTGNPYKLPNEARQYGVFEIDGVNFVRINSISLFVKDFPNTGDGKPSDIFISQLELGGAVTLFEENPDSSCALVLVTPKGYIFDSGSAADDTKTLTAQLRVKGKTVDPGSQKLPYYWFVENLFITPRSKEYSKYGGQGWQCLNKYNTVQQGQTNDQGVETVAPVVEFLPASETIEVKKSQSLAKNTKYKCAVVYEGKVFTNQIIIINNDSDYQIEITSDKGTEFYYDIGNPTLTCTCKKKNSSGAYEDVDPSTLRYIWGSANNANNFSNLPDTDEYNEDHANLTLLQDSIKRYLDEAEWLLYEELVDINKLFPTTYQITNISQAKKREAVSDIVKKLNDAGVTATTVNNLFTKYKIIIDADTTWSKLLDISESDTSTLSKTVESYNVIQRVEGNKIIDLNIRDITQFTIYKCSVFTKNSNQFLGTASITLNNTLAGEDLYSLVINNGSQVFKYNTHGVAPTSKQMKTPLEIPTLTFTIFDNLGNPIDNSVIKHSDIVWTVPAKNTLLVVPEPNYNQDILTPEQLLNITADNVKIFTGNMSFDYKIAERFDYGKTQNNIELRINYNGLNLVAKTDFTFTKQGASGTNGTDFVCKVVPNVISGSVPTNPTIYYDGYNTTFNWNCSGSKWFKAELWHNGNKPIFSGTDTAQSTEGKAVIVVAWEVLRNKYGKEGTAEALKTDSTNINVSGSSFSFNPGSLSGSYTQDAYAGWRPANIIKVTLSYDGYTYYGTLPVIVVRNFYSSSYRVNLKPNTGFRQVVYSSSGIQPDYDNHAPFELVVERSLGGNRWQDVSNKTYVEERMEFKWFYMGSVWYRKWVGETTTTDGTKRKKGVYQWVQDYEETHSDGTSSKKWLMDWHSYSSEQLSCQAKVKPADEYNGECLNIAMACRVFKASSGATVAWIHIPIHMLRNRYGNSAINGWDGNSVELGDGNGGTILAPQVGAGIKESDNSFTGILIGTAKDPKEETNKNIDTSNYGEDDQRGRFVRNDEQVGLFGYHKGSRSIFLDARTGKSVFGESGQAQIVIDPSQEDEETHKKVAVIRSGDYLYEPYDNAAEDTDAHNVDQGRVYRQPTGKGMMIDLSTPQIKFGSGNFEVDKNGHVIARGGGSIGGWEITDHAMYNTKTYGSGSDKVKVNSTGMNSNPVVMEGSTSNGDKSIYNGSQTREIKVPPTIIDDIQDAQTNPRPGYEEVLKAAAFWAGDKRFVVTHDGYLHAEVASIGSGTKPIYIGATQEKGKKSTQSVIFSGFKNAKNANQRGFYIGTDGIGIGQTFKIKALTQTAPIDKSLYIGGDTHNNVDPQYIAQEDRYVSSFQVDANGMFYARRGYIGNGRNGWQVGNTYLRNGKSQLKDLTNSTGIYISSTQGISLGRAYEVDGITGQATTTPVNAFEVSQAGYLKAMKGKIANWIISTNSIRNTASGKDRYGKKWTKEEWLAQGYQWIDPVTNQPLPKKWDHFYEMDVKTGSNSVYIGTGGIRLGSQFHVDDQGYLYAQNGFFTGTITAQEGKLGGWIINQNGVASPDNTVHLWPSELKLGTVTIHASGAMEGGNSWSITANGQANFSNMNVSGGRIGSGNGGGIGSNGSGVEFYPSHVDVPSSQPFGGGSFDDHIRKLVVNELNVTNSLTVGDKQENNVSYTSFRPKSHVTFLGYVNFGTDGNPVDIEINKADIDIENTSIDLNTCTIKTGGDTALTGVAEFSGGGKMQFRNGLLIHVTPNDADISGWAPNRVADGTGDDEVADAEAAEQADE